MERRPVLSRNASLPAGAPGDMADTEDGASGTNIPPGTRASIPWPGLDIRLNQILPGSVYLWACGERGDDDGVCSVSQSECCAGWVVLMVSAGSLKTRNSFVCFVPFHKKSR